MPVEKKFLEFFAGGGMARLGLGSDWRCLLANDIDSQKCAAYRENFGGDELHEGDIANLAPSDLPETRADLVWASFPCQDLSLAGARGGMSGARSGVFFSFWRHVETLAKLDRAPRMIVLENVTGLLTSNGGDDFVALVSLIAKAGYRVSALALDAARFTPQSRPRVFVFGFAADTATETFGEADQGSPPSDAFTPSALVSAYERLPRTVKKNWRWLSARPTHKRNTRLSSIVDWAAPTWHSPEQTARLIDMMSERQRERLNAIVRHKARRAGAAFRRTRIEGGETVQRVEARFDGLAGCLRTPAGGSSRQIIFAVENGVVRSRLLSPREAARLMGLPEDYKLPDSASAALKLCGDGVCVPVVQWIAEAIIEPALSTTAARAAKAA